MGKFSSISNRFSHFRQISHWGWAAVWAGWTALTTADWVVNTWAATAHKSAWNAFKLGIPSGWELWLLGTFVIFSICVFESSYRHAKNLRAKYTTLLWSDDRPILLFDSWGEVPHDHPEARFHEVSDCRKEREYFERGFFITNQGGTAHEVSVIPIQLSENIYAMGGVGSRIDKGAQGFIFVWMDIDRNAKFGEDFERWDLLKAMATLEKKLNSTRVEEYPLTVEVGVLCRDARGVWYLSFSNMTYRKDINKLVFGPTEQMRHGFTDKDVIQKFLTRP